ncbi:endonuclease IV [Candidatus Pacearchaeota archaeon CG10_big_fil_rev_8_21_14_0_10_34_76]|nr:MAG: endonuclease IV [Candidatus Pacearchaeota archaeon CG10_big_fil_rev_8_21_14_0_10_34_76]
MKMKIGPAGLGPVKEALERLEDYHALGFRACEIAFTYGVYIKKKEDADLIGKKARELEIDLSIHAPYWLNLNSSEKEKIDSSIERILNCCEVGEWLGAKTVVFHAGYYGKNKDEAYGVIRDGVIKIMEEIKKRNWNIKIAPETMGKVNVFGSVEEISNLVNDTGCSFCIDFAHILAREKNVDYEKIKKLFPNKKWHCHFSGIVYGEKGEKHHKTTEGKEWKELFSNLPKDRDIIIVNESPTMIDDCVEGIKIAKSIRL